MARRNDGDFCHVIFICLAMLMNNLTDWNVWWVEEKLALRQATVLIWFLGTIFTTLCSVVFITLSVQEYRDRNMSRREHISSAVDMDATITGLHDGLQCLISFIILVLYTYYYYHSCTDQSKPIPVADENGLDGLNTVRAILVSSIASCIMIVYHFFRKYRQSDDTSYCTGTDLCDFWNLCNISIIIIFCNIIIVVFALWLRHKGVC